MTDKAQSAAALAAEPDDVSVRRWFALYGLLVVLASVPLIALICREPWSWSDWIGNTATVFRSTGSAIKLLIFGLYLSACCTFLPLPTGWIVAGVATREAAVAAGLSSSPTVVAVATAAVVGAVGALGSTVANLNDYHLFTWMLRHHHVAKVRQTRTYRAAARWFGRSPLLILVIFNIVPIPVDVIRMLATTYRYPRLPFAVGNYVGRFVRYGTIAFVTYFWDLGWVAVISLLALAVLLGGGRVLTAAAAKLRKRRTNHRAIDLSEQ